MGNIRLSDKEIFDKLSLLDKVLKKESHKIYNPSFMFNSTDAVSVNKEARKMMDFVGLANYTAVITYSKTGINEGGNIELDNSKEVYIDISSDLLDDRNRVLAVMAHEICHKVLFVNGIYYSSPIPQIENEKLTDLATIYVGFDGLTLDGCYNMYTTDSMNQGHMTTTTHTVETGYLTLDTFARAHVIVCARYGVSPITGGMNAYALDAVSAAQNNSYKRPSIQELKDLQKHIQENGAEQMNLLLIIEDAIDKMKKDVINSHINFYDELFAPIDYTNNTIKDQFQIIEAFSKYRYYHPGYIANKRKEYLRKMIVLLKECIETNYTVLLDIKCPHCGYMKKNALKENKSVYLRCPNCGYYFLWNANIIELHEKKDNCSIEEEKTSFKVFLKSFFDYKRIKLIISKNLKN